MSVTLHTTSDPTVDVYTALEKGFIDAECYVHYDVLRDAPDGTAYRVGHMAFHYDAPFGTNGWFGNTFFKTLDGRILAVIPAPAGYAVLSGPIVP